jgi:AcrR family transcriptional regulator
MARPRSFDREAALDQAIGCFWANGFEETTIAGLTESMGINPPSLYAAFGDKDQLFAEAAGCYGSRLLGAVDEMLAASTAREGIARLLEGSAWYQTDPSSPPGCFMLSEPRLAEGRAELRRHIADRIRRGIRDGDVPDATDPDALAGFVLAVMGGMSDRARDGGERSELEAIGRTALAAVPQVS